MIRFGCRDSRNLNLPTLLLAALLLAPWAPNNQLGASELSRAGGGANHPAVITINSCAATACHGGSNNAQRGVWNLAYTVWQTHDPHAGAYATLHSGRSRRIVELLGGADDTTVSAASAFPNLNDSRREYERRLGDQGCVACHSTVQEDNWNAGLFRADGVNCQSCHGPAKDWQTGHVKTDWTGKSMNDKSAAGLNNLPDLAVRADVCCRCHVGSPATGAEPRRVVNHDLIAAGHPRLNFEFNAYFNFLTQQSAHWDVKAEQSRQPNSPAQRWAAGQVASARASLKLLEHHATQPAWPEFSQYDCLACHHSLRWPSFRQRNAQQPLGNAAWGTWYLPRSGFVLVELGKAGNDTAVSRLTDVMTATLPECDATRKHGAATVTQLDRVFPNHQPSAALKHLRNTVLREPRWNWDECTQWYLAAEGWQQSTSHAPENDIPEIEIKLKTLRELLNVPPLDVTVVEQSGTARGGEIAAESRADKVQSLVRALIVQFQNQKVPP